MFNALSGKKVYVVTVNDYLAERDANWMKPIYEYFGLTVGALTSAQDFKDTAEALFAGRLGKLDWIEKRPLSEGESSFQDLLRNKVAAPKIVLEPWQ